MNPLFLEAKNPLSQASDELNPKRFTFKQKLWYTRVPTFSMVKTIQCLFYLVDTPFKGRHYRYLTLQFNKSHFEMTSIVVKPLHE